MDLEKATNVASEPKDTVSEKQKVLDLEKATNVASEPKVTVSEKQKVLARHVAYVLDLLHGWRKRSARGEGQPSEPSTTENLSKTYSSRPGYPLYSFILGRQSEFQTFRRFRTLRMRLLLVKQDQICRLEKELKILDDKEEKEIYLGSCRKDMNGKRIDVLEKLDKAFSEYDSFLQRTQWALNQPQPIPQARKSQYTMVSREGYIGRNEYGYLGLGERELLHIGLVKDRSMASMAHVIESIVASFYQVRLKLFPNKPHDFVDAITISNPLVRGISRAVAASFAIILLLVPIVILNAVEKTLARFFIVFISATLFVSIITISSQVSMSEIFATGAAYTAVLVVFVSGNGVSGAPAQSGPGGT